LRPSRQFAGLDETESPRQSFIDIIPLLIGKMIEIGVLFILIAIGILLIDSLHFNHSKIIYINEIIERLTGEIIMHSLSKYQKIRLVFAYKVY
jgi:hypothetical protein